MLQGAIIGLVVALGMVLWRRHQAQQGTGLAGEIERALSQKAPMTLAEVAESVGKNTFLGKGEVAQSLNALASINKVKIHLAPEGTPQLSKVDFIRYELIG